ncbi:hypothetical protein [uncultured Photobacterium sp.]|uniref:hypothetical protein n=1 Tax=uncultured Photobacterium sp. TaxID=173973 RepID=UPI0026315073|nr:hypothetical protein [uncultured Photobacterium sp.]
MDFSVAVPSMLTLISKYVTAPFIYPTGINATLYHQKHKVKEGISSLLWTAAPVLPNTGHSLTFLPNAYVKTGEPL